MKLGLFPMPLHDPPAELAPKISGDRECVIHLDGLGCDGRFVGEHCPATSKMAEPVGLVIAGGHVPGSYEDVARVVVSERQRRGLFHAGDEGRTLRETLGIARPAVPA